MLAESHVAVVDRNAWWEGAAVGEPYEAGWAREAMIFVRALDVDGSVAGAEARVQISPDGIRWLDEGTSFAFPAEPEGMAFCRVREFGTWLRVAVDLPAGARVKVLVTLNLKQ